MKSYTSVSTKSLFLAAWHKVISTNTALTLKDPGYGFK